MKDSIIKDASGNELATITPVQTAYRNGRLTVDWVIRVKNRNGGYNEAYAATLATAKRKAKQMMREEQR